MARVETLFFLMFLQGVRILDSTHGKIFSRNPINLSQRLIRVVL